MRSVLTSFTFNNLIPYKVVAVGCAINQVATDWSNARQSSNHTKRLSTVHPIKSRDYSDISVRSHGI